VVRFILPLKALSHCSFHITEEKFSLPGIELGRTAHILPL